MRDPTRFEPVAERAVVEAVALDLSARESIETGVGALTDRGIEVDVLVNNAGQWVGGTLEQQDPELIYAMFQVNLERLISAACPPGA